MMHYITAQALGQARLASLHQQAQHDALARAARRARRHHSTPGLLAVVARWAGRPGPAPDGA